MKPHAKGQGITSDAGFGLLSVIVSIAIATLVMAAMTSAVGMTMDASRNAAIEQAHATLVGNVRAAFANSKACLGTLGQLRAVSEAQAITIRQGNGVALAERGMKRDRLEVRSISALPSEVEDGAALVEVRMVTRKMGTRGDRAFAGSASTFQDVFQVNVLFEDGRVERCGASTGSTTELVEMSDHALPSAVEPRIAMIGHAGPFDCPRRNTCRRLHDTATLLPFAGEAVVVAKGNQWDLTFMADASARGASCARILAEVTDETTGDVIIDPRAFVVGHNCNLQVSLTRSHTLSGMKPGHAYRIRLFLKMQTSDGGLHAEDGNRVGTFSGSVNVRQYRAPGKK